MILVSAFLEIVLDIFEKIIDRMIGVEIDVQHTLIRAHVEHLISIKLKWLKLIG